MYVKMYSVTHSARAAQSENEENDTARLIGSEAMSLSVLLPLRVIATAARQWSQRGTARSSLYGDSVLSAAINPEPLTSE